MAQDKNGTPLEVGDEVIVDGESRSREFLGVTPDGVGLKVRTDQGGTPDSYLPSKVRRAFSSMSLMDGFKPGDKAYSHQGTLVGDVVSVRSTQGSNGRPSQMLTIRTPDGKTIDVESAWVKQFEALDAKPTDFPPWVLHQGRHYAQTGRVEFASDPTREAAVKKAREELASGRLPAAEAESLKKWLARQGDAGFAAMEYRSTEGGVDRRLLAGPDGRVVEMAKDRDGNALAVNQLVSDKDMRGPYGRVQAVDGDQVTVRWVGGGDSANRHAGDTTVVRGDSLVQQDAVSGHVNLARDGELKVGDKIRDNATGQSGVVTELTRYGQIAWRGDRDGEERDSDAYLLTKIP
jgi:hypothetical protein